MTLALRGSAPPHDIEHARKDSTTVNTASVVSKTPRSAYALIDDIDSWSIGACVEGEPGYHPVPEYKPFKNRSHMQLIVDRLNERLGLSKVTASKIVHSTMRAVPPAMAMTSAQRRVLERMPDRPSDGLRLKGAGYMTAYRCVDKGWAVLVGRDLVGGHFARLPAGRAALDAVRDAWKKKA
jgi:hypothetical protein